MTEELFVFIRFGDRTMLPSASTALDQLDGLSRWDAVNGYFNLAIKMTAPSEENFQKLRALEGAEELAVCKVVDHPKTEKTFDPDQCQSYLLLETDADQRDGIQSAISAHRDVLFCHRTDGPYNLVAGVQSRTFDAIDNLVKEHIRPLDGILRLKQDRIISSNVRQEQ